MVFRLPSMNVRDNGFLTEEPFGRLNRFENVSLLQRRDHRREDHGKAVLHFERFRRFLPSDEQYAGLSRLCERLPAFHLPEGIGRHTTEP